MTKLEEVALAMRRRRIDLIGSQLADLEDDPSYLELALARAAVEVLRDPNAEMLSQREPIEYTMPEGEFRIIIDVATKYGVWHQMIDAILNDRRAEMSDYTVQQGLTARSALDDEKARQLQLAKPLHEQLADAAKAERRKASELKGCSYFGRWPGAYHLEQADMLSRAAAELIDFEIREKSTEGKP